MAMSVTCKLSEVTHPISLVNCYHPSSRAWWGGIDEFVKYLNKRNRFDRNYLFKFRK